MKNLVLAAAAAALLASPALGGEKGAKPARLVGPSQPIPYGQLDAYLKASAQERASKDWWTPSASAATGAAAEASATTAAEPARKKAKRPR